jgi:murein DD-endopeptidase MepM/ murein hydrolase activator NlpD
LGVVTSAFGNRSSPIGGGEENHKGVDIGLPLNTCALAVKSGVVKSVGYSTSYGNYVGYTTTDGYDIFYAHLNKAVVSAEDKIKQGQVLAYTGSTGSSTGPHIHIEMRKNNELVNPLDYFSVSK